MPDNKPPQGIRAAFIHDGRVGHIRQLEGLCAALNHLCEVQETWLQGTALDETRTPNDLSSYDLFIGAGHATHLAVLKLARKTHTFSCILMSPTLPNWLFDAVICPRHDKPSPAQNVFQTVGTINALQQDLHTERHHHLALIGGPSRHFKWDDRSMMTQLQSLTHAHTDKPWKIFTSPRTPDSTIELLLSHFQNLVQPRNSDLFNEALIRADQAWVTPDSANMLFESLSSAVTTGVFDLPKQRGLFKRNKLAAEIDTLETEGRIRRFAQHQQPAQRFLPPLNEAERAAKWLLDRYTNATQRAHT